MPMKSAKTSGSQCLHCKGTRIHPLDKKSVEACQKAMANRSDAKAKARKDGNSGERRSTGPR